MIYIYNKYYCKKRIQEFKGENTWNTSENIIHTKHVFDILVCISAFDTDVCVHYRLNWQIFKSNVSPSRQCLFLEKWI